MKPRKTTHSARKKALRPVDRAMSQDRSAKQSIRYLWVEEVRLVAQNYPDVDEPYYLTLSGAEAKDIELLISEGLIALTEANGISEKDQSKIVAVERSNLAIADLQKRFVGLRIKEADFRALIRGEGYFRWPEGRDIEVCRARVVNLDLNEALTARREENHQVIFPVLEWVRKLCQIHAQNPHIDWTLCLTLHGAVNWSQEINTWVGNFLNENFNREPLFAEKCHEFFGDTLYASLTASTADFHALNPENQQKIIMAVVPKIINSLVHNDGWKVRTEHNLWYGGNGKAPMVTWIFKFFWDQNARATPDAVYRTALKGIFDGAGRVLDDGNIEKHRFTDLGT